MQKIIAKLQTCLSHFISYSIYGISFVCLCQATTIANAKNNQPYFELLHLWGSDGETKALAAYSNAAKEQGVNWTEHVVFFNYLGVRAMYAKRLAIDAPPSGLFWIGGDSGKQMIDAGLFRKIPTKTDTIDFSKILRPEVYDVVKYDDGITILPVGSHIQNRIFYNQEILDEIGENPPDNWADFLKIAEKVSKAGYYAMIVTDQRWQNRYFFLAILAEKLNAQQMRRFLSGLDPVETYKEALLASMKIMLQLRPYTNPDIGDLSWDAAIGKIYHKNGFAYILGDFTGALIPKDDGSVLCASPPGNNYIMWAVDGIAFNNSHDNNEIAGQNILIQVVSNPKNHQKYLSVKGGVSAYVDSNIDKLDSCAKASKKAWDSADEKIFVTSEEWTQTLDVFATTTSTIWRTDNMSAEDAVAQIIEALRGMRHNQRTK